jgi:hypothetical protein
MAAARYLSASGASLVLHVAFVLSIAWIPWGTARRLLAPTTAGAAAAMIVTMADASELAGGEDDVPSAPGPESETLDGLSDLPATEFRLPGFAFDFGKVANRARSLFPFLTRPLPLDRSATRSNSASSGLSSFGVQRAPAVTRKPPLAMNDTALQDLVDRTWARRDRWIRFRPIVALIDQYDPDSERLARVLQAYLDQNILQPYVDTDIRDPRLWTMLGVAADNVDFIELVDEYTTRYPGTRVSTELLFLLDELAQGNHDGLAALLGTNPSLELWWTRNASAGAYELLVEIQQHYRAALERRGIANAAALRGYYDEVRLAILAEIVRTTPRGYRAGDARYLIGGIYWRQGQTSAALRWWREIAVDPQDSYAPFYADILDVLRSADPGRDRVAAARIDGILASEHRRWLDFSKRRLDWFGYALDEF